ncbi:histone-lysine N-methyltransferase SETMAR [Nephila pilipes]|uniref:Histone-lysine N-methyltransferase SETMAR n=1 Tax=Nephila pilipes TaxID=299642 RepID=A0A8X6IU73_NEPPI|nr:histone-lysine N-methyltransferase SETMAR [Nephila pilipes]
MVVNFIFRAKKFSLCQGRKTLRSTIEEEYLCHIMLLFIYKGMKAIEETKKKNNYIYGNVLKLNKSHSWFEKFKKGNRNHKDGARKAQLPNLIDDILKAMVDSDLRQTINELSLQIGCLWSSVQNHLSRIGKLHRQRIWVSHGLTETVFNH